MGIETNKDVVRRMVDECVNEHREELLGQFVAVDVRVHPGTPGAAPDAEGMDALRTAFRGFRVTFPDLRITLEQMVAEGDLDATRWTATGTHSAELAGIPATGRPVRWGGTDLYRLAGGLIAEWWRNDDVTELLRQLGSGVDSPS
jgi:predicted ester cyclase